MIRLVLSSEILGFPPDARVLLINADDLGMHPAVNHGVIDAVEMGIAQSCSLMTTCPGTAEAIGMLQDRPHLPFGVHLTLVRDEPDDAWSPLSPSRVVPTLVDEDGRFLPHARAADLTARMRIEEVEVEFRAQLSMVLKAGLQPTHLDFHSLADGGRDDVLDVAFQLADEHGLAVRVWLDRGRNIARSHGRPVIDHDFLDSFQLPVHGKGDRYAAMLRTLPFGLTEWAVHPASGNNFQSTAAPSGWQQRQTDLRFLMSSRARQLVNDEAINLIDYRTIQRVWASTH